MFRLGRQRGRRQADHSVVRRHYFCLGARYIQELFLSADTSERFADTINASILATNVATAQRRLPLPLTITSAPFLNSDRRDGTPLAARGFRLAQRNFFDIRNCFAALFRAFIRAKGGCFRCRGDSWLKLGVRTIRFMPYAATK